MMMMTNQCRDFLIKEIDDCRNFAIFQQFSEFSIKMKMKMIVSRNCVLLMIHEVIVLLMIDETIL